MRTVAAMMTSILLGVLPAVAAGQGLGRTIKGTVVDAGNKKPIAGASVLVNRIQGDAPSAKDGSFKVDGSDGQQVLIVRRPGYVPERIAVPGGEKGAETDVGQVALRQVKNDDDRAAVRAVDLEIHPRLASFYQRKDQYRGGAFFTPDEMERSAGALSSMVRQRTGFRDICLANRQGELDCGKSFRGPSTILGSGRPAHEEQQMCFVRVWTDDVGPERALDDIRTDEVLALEAYPNTNTTPKEFPGSSCATIRLWMKRAETQ